MRIAIVLLSGMYPDVIGGAEIFVNRLSEEFVKRGHEVHIVSRQGTKFVTHVYGHLFFWAYKTPNVAGIRFLIDLFQAYLSLIKIRPDVCFGVMFESALATWVYARIFNKPCFVRLAGQDFKVLESSIESKKVRTPGLRPFRRPVYSLIMQGIRRRVSFIAINKGISDGLLKLGVQKSNVHLVYNFVDDDFFDVVPNNKQPTVVFCGRIMPPKRVDLLVESFSRVIKKVPNAKLILVGDGSQRQHIEKLLEKYGISTHVEITGFVPHNVVKLYLGMASVFVLASDCEGTPNTMLQAMAAGLPVVATRVDGIPDFVEDNVNGLLVPPNDVTALSDAITFLLVNMDMAKCLGDNARKKVSMFKTARVVLQYLNLFNSANKSYNKSKAS